MVRSLAVILALALSTVPAAQTRQPPEAIARELQARYQSIRDFSADFVQTYRAGVLKTQTRESGTVSVKKPGKMRWTYSKPERKELVSDGRTLYWYVPADKQVIMNEVADQGNTPVLFLSGKGDIARDFTPSYADTQAPGTLALKLLPRRSEPDYAHLVVTLDPSTLQIRALTTLDHQGGESTLTFANMKENRGLSDKDFVFTVPRGVSVITDAAR
jgi:outer membrane lipoprotein carrier protein